MARVSVAGIRTFVEWSKSGTVHVEVDVQKRSYSVALRRADGARKEWTMLSSPKMLENAFLPLRSRIGAVVYEAGPTGFGLMCRLTRAGISVIVAAPSRVPRPVQPLPRPTAWTVANWPSTRPRGFFA